ncbi:MAG: DUF1893 domain-containing protein [Oscillospiraceae bacterium]|nr:DUF1893 domain-containing protein [Oscillospiraceae bacterium]
MTNLEKARALLEDGNFGNCILYKDGIIHAGFGKGIAPMLEFLEIGLDMNGFSAADTVAGKALALLFAYAGVKEVYAGIMSESAIDVFMRFEIRAVHGKLAEQIKNRAGDGICPMEDAVLDINGPEAAYEALKLKHKTLK